MICGSCLTRSNRVKMLPDGTEVCHNCGSFSEAGGAKTTGILTRNRLSVRTQAYKYEGDTILPTTYNKSTRKLDINPEFVKLYPDRVKDYYTDEEIKTQYPKLAKRAQKLKAQQKAHKELMAKTTEFVGDTKTAVEKAVKTPYTGKHAGAT